STRVLLLGGSGIYSLRVSRALSKVTAIIRPISASLSARYKKVVLKGIQYLRGRGRALAALSTDTILLIESGRVRIAEIDAVTLKLFALAKVSTEAKGLSEELKSYYLPEELLRSKLFEQLGDKGELKMLVNAANKTTYYNLELFKRI
ncbi:uncharacterized protein N7487_004364, partial [Penicillium crustosum]|uniref:uncharacterized protein n=1 Tax=Penicillium crustosum TaxID=36656 RepID=UPI00239FD1E4